jgi:hypothetical protein
MADAGEILTDQSRIYQLDQKTDHVQITAHGGPANVIFGTSYPKWKVPKDTWVVFYGPHPLPLLDPGYARIFRRSLRPWEVYGPESECLDYGLWKFQGYHGGMAGSVFGIAAKPFVSTDGAETYTQLKAAITGANNINAIQERGGKTITKNTDIVTIRYRPGWVHTRLSVIVAALKDQKAAKRDYRYIHCNFCRGMSGGHDVDENKKRSPTFHGKAVESQWWQ